MTQAKLLIMALFINTVCSSCAYAEINKDDFVIKVGLLKDVSNDWVKGFNNEQYVVYKETTQIPYIKGRKNPNFGFGYTLHTKTDIPFYHHAILSTPEPKNLSSQYMKQLPNNRMSLTTDKTLNSIGYLYLWLGYEEGDQPGLYTVDVFINDELLTRVEFNVKKQ